MTKMKQDNNVIDHTSLLYTENETELSCPIGQGTVYDQNQMGQRRDCSYRYDLRCQNWTVMTD